MKVLIVEDSTEMQLMLRKILSHSGAKVVCVDTAEKMRESIEEATPDLVLLDVCLPNQDGFQLFAELQEKEVSRHIPVIFITGKNEVTSKIAAFSLGAEDYIVKPFDPLEVKARLEAKIRKLSAGDERRNHLQRGDLKIDVTKQRVFRQKGDVQESISLTPKEFKLLVHLAKSEDTVFTRNQLMDAVWGSDSAVFDRTVDTHISSLRKKLGASSVYIESVLGTGYRFTTSAKSVRAVAA